jgi:hypothetical protein
MAPTFGSAGITKTSLSLGNIHGWADDGIRRRVTNLFAVELLHPHVVLLVNKATPLSYSPTIAQHCSVELHTAMSHKIKVHLFPNGSLLLLGQPLRAIGADAQADRTS